MSSSALLKGSQIDGVELRKLSVNTDRRGSFTEVFQKSWESPIDPVQFSVVVSEARVMRGCHLHMNHDEYFCLVKGAASVGLRDERPNSSTRGVWSLYFLCENDLAALMFPRGIVHGWYFHAASVHFQAVSEAYGDYSDYDNHRVSWRDPALEIPWPAEDAITSELAGNAPSLAEVRASLDRPQG